MENKIRRLPDGLGQAGFLDRGVEKVQEQARVRVADVAYRAGAVGHAVEVPALAAVDRLEQHTGAGALDRLQHLEVHLRECLTLALIQRLIGAEQRERVLRPVLELQLGDGAQFSAYPGRFAVHGP